MKMLVLQLWHAKGQSLKIPQACFRRAVRCDVVGCIATGLQAEHESAAGGTFAVSNACFFAFINSGDSDGDGILDWQERYNLNDHLGDLISFKEDFCEERGFWSDLDYEEKEVTGYADESEFVSALLLLFRRSEKKFRENPVEYGLVNRNCATWVNGILKAAGISDVVREKIGDFSGIDWGEESDALDDWFKER